MVGFHQASILIILKRTSLYSSTPLSEQDSGHKLYPCCGWPGGYTHVNSCPHQLMMWNYVVAEAVGKLGDHMRSHDKGTDFTQFPVFAHGVKLVFLRSNRSHSPAAKPKILSDGA